MMNFIFDMDGTIADLYHVENWLSKLRASDPSPYAEARPMWDMDKLGAILEALQALGHTVTVVSWLSKESTLEYNRATRAAKRAWLKEQNFPFDEIHLVKYGTPKSKYSKSGAINIFFDDSEDVAKEVSKRPDTVRINPEKVDIVEFLENFLGEN